MGNHRITTGHVHDRGRNTGAARGSAPWQRRLAARAVASNAVDVGDCAELLEILGLTATDGLGKGEAA
jgi:hypothetical protein